MLRVNLALFVIAFLVPVGCGAEAPARLDGTHPLLAEEDGTLISVSGTASLRIITGDQSQFEAMSFLSIVPEHILLEAGGTITINAYAYSPFGQPLDGVAYSWELVDESAGRITAVELTAGDAVTTFPDAIRVTGTQVIDGLTYQISQDVSVVVAVPKAEAVLSSVESITDDIVAITGGLVRLQAIAFDPLGRIIPEARIEWELNDRSLGEMIGTEVLNVRVG